MCDVPRKIVRADIQQCRRDRELADTSIIQVHSGLKTVRPYFDDLLWRQAVEQYTSTLRQSLATAKSLRNFSLKIASEL